MKYYCRDCKQFLKKAIESTGNQVDHPTIEGLKIPEVKTHIIFLNVRTNSEDMITKMYHNDCIQKYKSNDSFEVPIDAPSVVMVD